MKKALLITGAATTIGLASVLGVGIATAQSDNKVTGDLVNKIASRFNLKTADVQKVFDEERAANQAERQQKLKADLDQAVKDGKITQKQEDLIIAKHKEMATYMDSLKGKTRQEHRTAMDTKRDELKKWATDNNIPEQYVLMGGHEGRGIGPKRGEGL